MSFLNSYQTPAFSTSKSLVGFNRGAEASSSIHCFSTELLLNSQELPSQIKTLRRGSTMMMKAEDSVLNDTNLVIFGKTL